MKMNGKAAVPLDSAREALARGDVEKAISCFRRALLADDTAAEVHRDLGRAYLRRGWHAEAEHSLREAIRRKPDDSGAHADLAAAVLAQGRLDECRRAYARAGLLAARGILPAFLRWKVEAPPPLAGTDAGPAELAAQVGLVASMIEEEKLTEEALARLENLAGLYPSSTECRLVLARAYSAVGRIQEAAQNADAAMRLDPCAAEVFAEVSTILQPWDYRRAEQFARRALEMRPDLESAHRSLSTALSGQDRLAEAERHGREALRLNPARLASHLNLATILKRMGRVAEARALYLTIDPAIAGSARACAEIGYFILECGGDLEEARAWYRRAQSLSSDPLWQLAEATLDLLFGNFAAGWERYEARKRIQAPHVHRGYERFPQWDGTPIAAEHLLVYGEQGLGDEIMFASILPDVQRRARRITQLCDLRLEKLFARSFPSLRIVGERTSSRGERAASMSDVDRHIAAGSLGRLFRRSAADFPQHAGYLTADPARVQAWSDRLASLGPGFRIGLSWQGGVQGTGRSRRSIPLAALAPVLAQPGVCWISLQHGDNGDIARHSGAGGLSVAHYEGVTDDLDDLAALVECLDLVVSVCNTNVHLAGALGKEVWVMAPFVPEWRYGREGKDMPWYPSARVMRQARYGDWSDVLGQVAAGLADRASSPGTGEVPTRATQRTTTSLR